MALWTAEERLNYIYAFVKFDMKDIVLVFWQDDFIKSRKQYINQIIERVFPDYEIEFVGYERDDPKQILDLSKGEMESYKTVNEVRREKGLPPLPGKWADECPANPQLTQMYQSAQAQGGGMEYTEDAGGDGWGDVDGGDADGGGVGGQDFGTPDDDGEQQPDESGGVAKSFVYEL